MSLKQAILRELVRAGLRDKLVFQIEINSLTEVELLQEDPIDDSDEALDLANTNVNNQVQAVVDEICAELGIIRAFEED